MYFQRESAGSLLMMSMIFFAHGDVLTCIVPIIPQLIEVLNFCSEDIASHPSSRTSGDLEIGLRACQFERWAAVRPNWPQAFSNAPSPPSKTCARMNAQGSSDLPNRNIGPFNRSPCQPCGCGTVSVVVSVNYL